MITLDNSAVEYFCSTMKGGIVRLSLKGGGCNGFTYDWQLLENLEQVQENDEVFDYDEFTFVVDGMSLVFLAGSTVEYKKNFVGSYLSVENPNMKSSCGCGESISI